MNVPATLLSFCLAMAPLAAEDAPAYRDPGLQKIAQVAIVCKDIQACSQRWAALLGMPAPAVSTTRPGGEVGVTYRGKPSAGRVKLAFLRSGQTQIELMEPVGGDTAWKEGLDKNGEGIHHLGFQVRDLEKTIAQFQKEGMGVVQRGRYDSEDGTYVYLDTEAKLGVMIELLHSDPRK